MLLDLQCLLWGCRLLLSLLHCTVPGVPRHVSCSRRRLQLIAHLGDEFFQTGQLGPEASHLGVYALNLLVYVLDLVVQVLDIQIDGCDLRRVGLFFALRLRHLDQDQLPEFYPRTCLETLVRSRIPSATSALRRRSCTNRPGSWGFTTRRLPRRQPYLCYRFARE